MNRTSIKINVFFILLFSIICQFSQAQLITYKEPKGSVVNNDFTVRVRQKKDGWQPVFSYLAHVSNMVGAKSVAENTSFSYFDFSGQVDISITYNKGAINDVRIRPLSIGIKPKISGNTITFSLHNPQNLSIEVNGDIFHNLQLFANPLETYKISPKDTNVIYYGPGIHQVGTLNVTSNKTIYIAGGAIVQGQLLVNKVENVRVLGHGILSQEGVQVITPDALVSSSPDKGRQQRGEELNINFSKNVEVNGIIVIPHKYSVFIGQSKGVKVSEVKSISSEGNADGLDVFCSTDVVIDKLFMRNSDDCIAIYGHRRNFYGNTKNITVSNSTLWADQAHPILIGTHGDPPHPDTLGNMKFNNIDILDQYENQIDYQGCIALNAGDANLINNINFENIRIEDIRKGQLFNFRVMFNHKYNTAAGRGVENIYFKNISYTGTHAIMSIIAGYDDTRSVRNITFENFTINGKLISDTMPDKPSWYKIGDMSNIFIGEHVDGLRFIETKK